jgi:hypothetical protein
MFVHFIEFDHFRIVLCDPFSLESLRYDLEMDYSTLDYFFSGVRFVKDQYAAHRLDRLKSMTNRIEPRKLEEDLHEGMELLEFDRAKVNSPRAKEEMTFEFENMPYTKSKVP